ncbi:MAG: alpha/beta fold hydrolase [Woeseiaceae bacterium]|nr:alpha/beta fold hydrolase [Woeseiaceae bacterium]
MSTVFVAGRWLATVVVVLLLTIYFGRAYDALRMPPLGPEHRIQFDEEFNASMENDTDWAAYLAIEDKLAAELAEKIPSQSRPDSPADRYFANSLVHPDNFDGNWNHSYEMTVPSPRGVAVMLHGLTDSPYSMLATAQTLAGAGYNVVAMRMPGHGFAVGGLLQARWQDWTAAVRIAIRRAVQLPGADESLLLVGYSNGGLLAVDYALQCTSSDELRCPDGLVLMSPGMAITSAAAVMSWHAALSWMPYFEQFKWLQVLPEVDPFKFTSFPKQAALEVHQLSSRVHDELADPDKAANMPPVLTFQSSVDNTVGATAIVSTVYDRLPPNGSELVLYDVNRNSTMLHLMEDVPDEPADHFTASAPLDFGVTILRNRDPSSNAVDVQTLAAGQTEAIIAETKLRWPIEIYSLSHIAIPFRPDDRLYGDGSFSSDSNVVLGALAPRGERDVLLLEPEFFLRIRHNPFFEFQSQRLTEWLDGL